MHNTSEKFVSLKNGSTDVIPSLQPKVSISFTPLVLSSNADIFLPTLHGHEVVNEFPWNLDVILFAW